jgi:nitrous oxidase accessory protein
MLPSRLRPVTAALLLALAAATMATALHDQDASSHGETRANVDAPKPTFMLRERNPRVHGLQPFQELVDAAPAGSVLTPPPGQYRGPVQVDKPLVIDGHGQVTIDGGDRGTVFILRTDGATLRGVHLTGSGDSPNTDDSCLDVRGDRNVIEALTIDNCLFGIDLKQSNHTVVRQNRISSKPLALGMRGDGLRLWYSNDNLIEDNQVVDSRDMVAWYSSRNVYRGNEGRRSRYSLHFMFANDNLVENNRFYDNAVGVYLMYTERVHLRNNVISHATGAAGMAVGFKEASDSDIEGNEIIYCAVGIGSDLSPFQPDTTIRFKNNRIAYNGIGFQFTSELGGNIATGNVFEGNLTNVVLSGRGKAGLNQWHGNYWDDYQGFDRNGDGVGDTPYELNSYVDRIWVEIPGARFFKNSPAMELLDFLERLAPFSSPELQVRDEAPLFTKAARKS